MVFEKSEFSAILPNVSIVTTTSSQPPHVPHHLVARAIGRGSYGEIWLARSLTGAWRAVKIVERKRFEDTRAFEREFEGMAQFEPISREHQGFVDILHVGRSDDDAFFYYVMELADDVVQRPSFEPWVYQPKTIKSELQRVARISADEVIALGLSLTTALAALHRHGLVHRDIKPANIIICGGLPKIADIGLVSALGQNSFVGTEGYVPPEGPGTVQADIYSLGKVLYEIAMGKDRLDFPAINTRIDELPDRDLLLRLNEVLLRACHFDTLQRYATADEMHEDLLRVRDGQPLLGVTARRRRRIWPIAAALLACVGGIAWWKMDTPPPGGTGSVWIESEPPGVEYRIESLDGRFLKTNALVPNLPVGEHTAHTLSPLYDREDFKFTVTTNTETKVPLLKLKRSLGKAILESRPPGCEFEILSETQSIRSGKTPLVFTDLPTGRYEVVFRHEKGEKRKPLEVRRWDGEEPEPIHVEFGYREIQFTSTPPGAEVALDGKVIGTTPFKSSIVEGPHKISARYRKWPEQVIEMKDDSPETLDFKFLPGSVKISTAPSGAEVFVGDKKMEDVTPYFEEDLEPGPFTYTLKLPGFPPITDTAMITPGKQVSITKRFEPERGPRRGAPWENSLGMKFVPVGDILVGIWPVRKSDFKTYCEEEGRPVVVVDFPQEDNHPVVRVNWEDATAFCEWLTRRELAANKLEEGQIYRLPTDAEWSAAAGMASEGYNTPEQRDGLVKDFPWGKAWPPPPNSGNFADTAYKKGAYGSARNAALVPNYTDGFSQTSPVGSFPPNKFGLYDMCGNVWQWVADSYNGGTQRKDWGVLRGASWGTCKQEEFRLGYRDVVDRGERDVIFGFRCVLVPER